MFLCLFESFRRDLNEAKAVYISEYLISLICPATLANVLNFVFVFVYIARIYILCSFTNEKGELTILTTKPGLLVSYTTRKVCFLTTNYGYNEFAELKIGKFIF